jgi:hypothetical protein
MEMEICLEIVIFLDDDINIQINILPIIVFLSVLLHFLLLPKMARLMPLSRVFIVVVETTHHTPS